MNKAYRSIYNEKLGTFVAVAENVKARGKKSSSARKGVLAAAVASALALSAGGVLADVDIPDPGNEINFTTPNGSINFGSGGSITGLASLTVNGALTADQLTVGGEQVATSGQLSNLGGRVDTTETDIANLGNRVDTTETGIADLGGRVGTTETDIVDLDGRVGVNETGIDAINTSLGKLGVDESKQGIKYFRVNSTGSDAIANGADSVAIGPNAKSEGANSLAAGNHADAREANSLAVGNGAISDGESAIALGDGAKISKPTNGSNPVAAIAIGMNSESSGTASTAIGKEANASGTNAVAFGSSATAAGASSVALGHGAQAMAQENISIGKGAGFNSGDVTPGDQKQNIAIGVNAGSDVSGQINAALGYAAGQNVKGNDNVAFGRSAGSGIEGTDNISIGQEANINAVAHRAIGIGQKTKAETEGVAIGFESGAGNKGVAVGRHAQATGTGTAIGPDAKAASGYVALGLGSIATQGDISAENSRFTNRSFSGSAVSVGSSAEGNAFTRRIVNVEDGANDTDAVNVRQLQQAVSGIDLSDIDIDFADGAIKNLQDQIDKNMLEYVSINDGGTDKGNKNNNGAQATNSMAIGPDATANKADSIAIGHKAGAEGESAVVLGHNIKGLGANSTTIGNSNSEARDESGIAIGTKVTSRDENSIVIGRDSYTNRQGAGPSVKNSIVIGTASSSTAEEGIVLGKDSIVNAAKGIAQGSNAHATAENAMAFGTDSRASAVDSQASGTGAHAYAQRGIAMGQGARSGEANPNVNDVVNNRDSIAIGSESVAEMNSSTAMGRKAQATANFAQAFGENAQASGAESIAQGRNAKASSQQAIAVGSGAESTASQAMAIGQGAKAQNDRSIAIGQGAVAQNARSVALGDGAVTAAAVGTTNATLNNLTYGSFSGNNPMATVSVGTATEKRTITNVAAGRISGTSTDAINGSQLFATNTVLGNVANSTKTSIGGETTIAPDGTITTINVGDTGENNIHDAIKYAAQGWDVSANAEAGENVAPGGSVDFSSDDNINIVRDGTDLKFALNKDLTIGDDDEPGTIVVKGEDGKDGVTINGKDGSIGINGKDGANGTITVINGVPGLDGAPGTRLEVDGKEIATLEDGLKFAGNTGDTIGKKLNETLTVKGELADDAAASGANLRVDSDGEKLNLVMAKNLTDLDSITINNGGPVISSSGINMGGKQITKLGSGLGGQDLADVTGDDLENAVNVGDLQNINNAAGGGGFGLADASDQEVKKNLGQTIKVFDPDGNIVTTADNDEGELQLSLSNELTVGDDEQPGSVVVNGKDGKDGVTINGEAGSIGLAGTDGTNGLTLRGDQGAPGVAGTDGITRIVYEDDEGNNREVATMDDGLRFSGNENPTDGYVTRKLNEEMQIVGGAQTDGDYSSDNIKTVATQDGGIEIQFAESPQFGNVTINTDGEDTINGLTNLTFDPEDYVSGQAATEDQLKQVSDVANSGWNVKTSDTTGVALSNVGPEAEVDFVSSDENITIEHTRDEDGNTSIDFALGNDLSVGGPGKDGADGEDGFIGVNGADGKTGVAIDGADGSIGLTGPAGADGENPTLTIRPEIKPGDVINDNNDVTRLTYEDGAGNSYTVATLENDGLRFSGNDNTGTTDGYVTRNLNKEMQIVGGAQTAGDYSSNNIKTVATQDGGIELQMAEAPKFGEITINNDGKISGVEAGVDDDDAVNVGQLEKGLATATTGVEAGKNIKVTKENPDPDKQSVYTVETEDDVAFDSVTSEDEAGNKTVLNPEGVTIAGPDETVQATQLGSTQITVGGENPIVMNGNSGTITGLTNTTLDLPDFGTKGRAATEEQLQLVSSKGLNFSGNYGGDIHKALGEKLEIIGDGEWIYTQEIDGKLHIKLAQNFPVVPNPDVTEGGNPGNGGGTGEGNGGEPGEGGNGGAVNPPPAAGETPGNIVAGGVIKPGSNITVSESGDYDLVIGTTPDVNHNSVTVGDVVINQGGISMGGNKITNLAPGVDGTDAVNVDQLDKVKETAEKGWNVSTQGGTATQVKPGDTVDFANKDGNIVVANNGTNVTVDLAKDIAVNNIQVDNSVTVGGKTNNQTIIKDGSVTTNEVIIKRPGNPDGDMNVGETLNKGITFVGTEGQTERKLGDTLEIVGANDNITTKVNGPKGILEIALSNDLAIDSVTINNGGPIINENGINMVDKRITNVADGIDVGDAVNVGQLGKVQDNLQGQVNHLRHDIRRMDKKLSAGVAAAMATAGLPQAYLPGKSMMAMSGGTWNGESGMAIGFSTITDSGKWVVKAAGNATGRGDYGGTVGVGYQW